MTIKIDNPEVDSLARELASRTGESITQVIIVALRERLEREKGGSQGSLAEELVRIGAECASLPVQDKRSPDEILGYDANGLPSEW